MCTQVECVWGLVTVKLFPDGSSGGKNGWVLGTGLFHLTDIFGSAVDGIVGAGELAGRHCADCVFGDETTSEHRFGWRNGWMQLLRWRGLISGFRGHGHR
jgi:hypothetical protein